MTYKESEKKRVAAWVDELKQQLELFLQKKVSVPFKVYDHGDVQDVSGPKAVIQLADNIVAERVFVREMAVVDAYWGMWLPSQPSLEVLMAGGSCYADRAARLRDRVQELNQQGRIKTAMKAAEEAVYSTAVTETIDRMVTLMKQQGE